jgi:hypothetical protein
VRLFHVSETPGIAEFVPRLASIDPTLGAVVWAIDVAHTVNYLLPRDCPRVTFAAAASTSADDRSRFGIGEATRVIVIEAGWLRRVVSTPLYRYEFDGEPFTLLDANAGYWVTRQAARPLAVTMITDPVSAIVSTGAELRVMHGLWSIHGAVAQSTLEFSMIRMRNAAR